jgi:ABC-type nitrate/sulfonate/bicarbonate transport system substrate-binding protein
VIPLFRFARLALALGILASCGSVASASSRTASLAGSRTAIKIALPTAKTSFANSDVVIAMKEGFFAAQGLDVTIENLASGTKTVQAVVSGDAQIGGSSIEPPVMAVASGSNITIIGSYADRLTVSMVTPDSIKKVTDLRGKNVGVQDIGSFREIMTRMVLQSAHLTPHDVHYVPLSTTGYIPALLAGRIQAAILQREQAAAIEAEAPHFHELVDLYRVLPEYDYGTYFVQKSWLDHNRNVAVGFLTALIKAHRFMYDNPKQTIQIAATATGFSPSVMREAYQIVVVKDKAFPVNDGLETGRLTYTINKMKSLGLLTRTINLNKVVDWQPVNAALKTLGRWKQR